MSALKNQKNDIKKIYKEAARLFEKYMSAVEAVVAYNKENGASIDDRAFDKETINECLEFLINKDLSPYYREILKKQIEMSDSYERKLFGLDCVAYQGAEGAFGHIAAGNIFPTDNLKKYGTFAEVFDAIENGDAYKGVIPFENSYTGEVGEVLDLLYSHNVYIESIYDQPVRQNLIGIHGAEISDIKTVYSHPQALEQVSKYLNMFLPRANCIAYTNTALAAKLVAKSGDKSIAAIASDKTAQLYNLSVLAKNINTSAANTTRFIVISKKLAKSGNRFNLLFTVDHAAGQLAKVLSLIGEMGFNVENIRSRSVHGEPWKYYFYAEIEGTLNDSSAQKLLDEMNKRCDTVKILGHYVKSE